MDTKTMTLAALLAAALAGNVYLLDKGEYRPVTVVAEPTPGRVELKTADAVVLLAEAANAETIDPVVCSVVAFSNYSGCYCKSGTTKGWPSNAADCPGTIEIDGGKVYTTTAAP